MDRQRKTMESERLKVGELAGRVSLSVRTLHHYDEIGLLSPAERTPSGHRLYGPQEIARLQQICSLRQLGLSLEEIRDCLERTEFTPEHVIGLHLVRLHDQIDSLQRLVGRLDRLAARLRAAETVSVAEFIQTIEEIRMTETYFTPEQMEQLEARRKIVGKETIQRVERQWADLAARVKEAMDAGEDPKSGRVREIARAWRDLTRETVEGFAGGDRGIEASVARMWKEEPGMGTRWGLGPEVREYIGVAMATLKDSDADPRS